MNIFIRLILFYAYTKVYMIELAAAGKPRCTIAFDSDICLRPVKNTNNKYSKKTNNVSAPPKTNTTASTLKPNQPPSPTPSKECNSSSAVAPEVCRKHYIISSFQLEPYTEELVIDSLKTCCGPCVNYSIGRTFTKVADLPSPDTATSHFVFPVLGRTAYRKLYQYHFIPLIETPSIYYVTLKGEGFMLYLIKECLQMWPLLLNCLFMVIISGFLGWLMETWGNQIQFPRSFVSGWFEGIWWSFISMTTVGYGDKSPKSILARLFAVIWIMIGITTFSLITATLSSELTKANSLTPPQVNGAVVGALPNRLHDALVIAKHGGILVNVKSTDTIEGVQQLLDKLKQQEIDGFAIDRYVLLMLYRYLEKTHPEIVHFLKMKTVRTELKYSGAPLSYGALVKETEDYDFLVGFVEDNKNVLNLCNKILISNFSSEAQETRASASIFLVSGIVFWPTFGALMVTVGFLGCFGLVYEFVRRRKEKNAHIPIPRNSFHTRTIKRKSLGVTKKQNSN